jgi:uncharacterized protein YkwD
MRPLSRLRFVAYRPCILVSLLLVASCGLLLGACRHGAPASQARVGATTDSPEDARVSATYDSQPSTGLVLGDAVDEPLRAALENACADGRLASDGRLAELARAVARATQGEAPSASLVSFHAARLGLSDPTPQLWLANASESSAVLPSLAGFVRGAIGTESLTHCGGAALRGGHGVLVAVALSRRLVTFASPIPRRVEPGGSLALSATLAAGYDDAVLAITTPRGDVERTTLGAGRRLKTTVSFPERGEVTLELLARGPEGVTVVALLTIAVGIEPRSEAPGTGGQIVERDPEAVVLALNELIARERKARKLAPLAQHEGLARVARAHTDDMLAHHFVAHTSQRTGEAHDRVARAGLHSVVLLENIGRGYSAEEIHAGLMESPGHRANILNPGVRVLGIGVGAEREGERQAFVATQLFARLAEATDLKSAARDLYGAIASRRASRKLAKAELDRDLSQAAQAAADAFAARPKDEALLLDRATRSVRALPGGAAALSAALIQAEELAQVAESDQLLLPELVALGIGVAALPADSPRQIAVVLLLALRR